MSEIALSQIPDHVPAELVRDFDFLQPHVVGDLYDWWSRLRDGPEIFFTPRHGGHWVTTLHDDIAYVLEHFETFRASR